MERRNGPEPLEAASETSSPDRTREMPSGNWPGLLALNWPGLLAMVCLSVLYTPRAHATRPLLPTCDMRYPALQRESLSHVMDMLRVARSVDSACLVRQLPKFGERALNPLFELLRTGSEQGRINAAAGLAALRAQALPAIPELTVALDDASGSVRWMTLGALSVIEPRSPELDQSLLLRLDRSTPATLEGEALIEAISRMGSLPPEALPVLDRALQRLPSYEDRAAREVIDAIGHVDAPQQVALLAQLIGDEDPDRAREAALAAGRSGGLAVPVLMYRLIGLDGEHREICAGALGWAWTVATAPALSLYYQTDTTTLMRQLKAPLPAARAQALKRAASLAPVFLLQIPGRWHGDEESRIPQVRCDLLDALADAAGHVKDEAEQRSMNIVADAMRQAAPHAACPVQIY